MRYGLNGWRDADILTQVTQRMRYGLNGWRDGNILTQVAHRGWQMLRFGLPSSRYEGLDMLAAAQIVGRPLIIITDTSQLVAYRSALVGLDVEFHNEPDGTIDRQFTPTEYAELVPAFVRMAHDVGAFPWIGAVGNTAAPSQAWLRSMLAALPTGLPEFGITFHWYSHGRDRQSPHPGFQTRAEETAGILSIIGDRRWAISEFGFHTAKQRVRAWLPWWFPGNTYRWTDGEVARMVREEFAYWERHDAEFAILYQIADGPHDTKEERFGILRCDPDGALGEFKPVADAPMR